MREQGSVGFAKNNTEPAVTIVRRFDSIASGQMVSLVHELQDRVDAAAQALDVLRIKLLPVSREVRTGDCEGKEAEYQSGNLVGREVEATIRAVAILTTNIKQITDHLEV